MSIADTLTHTDSVSSTIEKWASRLIDVSHTIHAHPELAFEEHRASALLADAAQKPASRLLAPPTASRRHSKLCEAPAPSAS